MSTSAQRMADRLADGKLAEAIGAMKAEGLSYDAIARRLYADHGIEVGARTLAAWARSLGVESTRAAS